MSVSVTVDALTGLLESLSMTFLPAEDFSSGLGEAVNRQI